MADYDPYLYPYHGLGSAYGVSQGEYDARPPKAVLWVPDPEQRHGWREVYVKPKARQPKPRAAGFAASMPSKRVKRGR